MDGIVWLPFWPKTIVAGLPRIETCCPNEVHQMPVSQPLQMTNPVAVRSSSLAHVAYDSRRDILQVAFRDGTVYQYDSVPLGTYHALLQAESKGGYFNR